MQAYENARRDLALSLEREGAVLTSSSNHPRVVIRGAERGFRLKLHESSPDAPLSPIFLNLRTPDNPNPGPLTPGIVDLAARCMRHLEMGRRIEYDGVVGIPNAGEPFADAFSKLCGKPAYRMSKKTEDGKRRIVASEGLADVKGKRILLIDDLITKADSKIEATGVLWDSGAEVKDIIVLVDRGQGGASELADRGYRLSAVFHINELLDIYTEAGKMSPDVRKNIREYLAA